MLRVRNVKGNHRDRAQTEILMTFSANIFTVGYAIQNQSKQDLTLIPP